MTTLTIFSNKAQEQLLLGGKSSIPLPDSIIADSITCLSESGQSMSFRVLAKNNLLQIDAKEDVIVTFLFKALTWKCLGRMYINEDSLQLHILGQVTNADERELSATVTLVTGKQNEISIPYSAPCERMAKVSVASETAFLAPDEDATEDVLEDYRRYEIGEVSIVGSSTTTYPLSTHSFPYTKVYLVNTNRNDVSYGYRIVLRGKKARKAEDIYIPTCNLSIYKENLYLGSALFKEARQGDERIISTGSSSQIRCNNSVQTQDETGQDVIGEHTIKTYTSEVITCEIFNRDEKTATILIRHPLRDRNIEEISPMPKKIEEGFAVWEVKLERGKILFEAHVIYYNILHLDKTTQV